MARVRVRHQNDKGQVLYGGKLRIRDLGIEIPVGDEGDIPDERTDDLLRFGWIELVADGDDGTEAVEPDPETEPEPGPAASLSASQSYAEQGDPADEAPAPAEEPGEVVTGKAAAPKPKPAPARRTRRKAGA